VLLVACALPRPALAQAQAAPAALSPQAQYRQAHEAMNAKRWDDARRLLLELWTQSHTYDVASELMFVEYHLGHYAAAANYGAFATRNVPPVADAGETARLQRGLDEVKKRVGAISVSVDRPGAEVHVDSAVVGTSPLASDVYVDVGPHRVRALLDGAFSPELRVDALAGETYKVELTLPPPASHHPQPPSAPGLATSAATPASPRRTPSHAPAIVAASVGGAALAGGIVALVVSTNQHAKAQDRLAALGDPNACGTGMSAEHAAACQDIANQADSSHTLRTLSVAGFGTALVAGALTYVLWPKAHSHAARNAGSHAARLEPTLDVAHHGFFAALGCHF
jgi:hypothetical protein